MLVVGQQVPRLVTSFPGPANARVSHGYDKTALALVCDGAVADQVDIDRTAQRYRGIIATSARGQWVDTEGTGRALQG
jgi:hypothetical protein